MDFGERIAISLLEESTDKCPYKEKNVKYPLYQENDSKVLAAKMALEKKGKEGGRPESDGKPKKPKPAWPEQHGDDDYLKGTPHCAGEMQPLPRPDSTRDESLRIKVDGKEYKYMAAPHHLIPGVGSLEKSTLFAFMSQDQKVPTVKGTRIIKANIGYCVNGRHNGAWLASSYAFRAREETPAEVPWSEYAKDNPQWAIEYMTAAVKAVKGQFHDSHGEYEENCLDLLEKLATALCVHPDYCKLCEKKKSKIPPPYAVKDKLYRISKWLRQKMWPPRGWKDGWMTSEQFANYLISNRSEFE